MNKRYLLSLLTAACAFVGCTKEIPVSYPREIKAEFPSDQKEGEYKNLLFLDGIDTPLTADGIKSAVTTYKPDMLFLCTSGSIEGKSTSTWMKENLTDLGHSSCFSAGGNAVSTSLKWISADSTDLFVSGKVTERFLKVKLGGYNFICGNITNKNTIYKNGQKTLMGETVVTDGLARWIVVCHAWWEGSTAWDISQYYWPGYGYNEAVFSKFGKDCYPLRKELAFVSEGVLNCISDTECYPIRFTFKYGEE